MPKHPTQVALELVRKDDTGPRTVAAFIAYHADEINRGLEIDDYPGDQIIQESIKSLQNLARSIRDVGESLNNEPPCHYGCDLPDCEFEGEECA